MARTSSLRRGQTIAVVDIESGGVAIALLTLSKEGPSQVIAHGRSQLSLEEQTPKQAIALIGQHIKEASAHVLEQYTRQNLRAPIGAVYCIIHAPWARSTTLSATVRFPAEVRIQQPMLVKLAQQSISAQKEINMKTCIEACVIRVELNGYPTAKPEGKFASDVKVTSIIGDCDAEVRANVSAAVQQSFPAASIRWCSEARSLLTVFREAQPRANAYLAIDMGLDVTHLISVRYGLVVAQRTIPEGMRTILSRIDGTRLPDETLGLIRMLSRDACEGDACESLQKAIAIAEPELARIFGEGIGAIASTQRVANNAIVIAHPDLSDWLTKFFSRIDFTQFTVTTLPLDAHTLSSADLHAWVSNTEGMDSSLMVACALVNIEAHYTQDRDLPA